jgi:ribosomal-protein-alanine N-acetyltransferase
MAMDVTIVAMRSHHVDALMPYERSMFGTEAWTRGGYLNELSDTRNRWYVAAEEAGALVGWAGILFANETADILTVGTVPEARRRGIARRLVQALTDEAVRRGVREIFLEVRVDNLPARALYEAEGFTEVGRRPGYYDSGRVEAVTMRRAI